MKPELKVTNHGEGTDSPVWSHGGVLSSSESSFDPDSGFSSTQKNKGDNTAGSTVQQGHSGSCDQTPLLSLNTICRLDRDGDFNDRPLSDQVDYKVSNGDQEMTITEDRHGATAGDKDAGPADTETGNKDMGHNQRNPVDTQDLVLPCTSALQPGPTRPNTEALASAVEIWALTLPALALTMAQIQEAAATSDTNGDTDEEKVRLDAYKGVMQG